MPFGATELQEWVKGLDISPEDQRVVLEKLGGEKVIVKVGSSIMAQRDYSRGMDELKAEKTRLETDFQRKVAEEERVSQEYMGSLGKWKTDKEKVLNDAVLAREQAEQRVTAIQGKIKELAPTYAIPESELSSLLAPVTAPAAPRRDDPPREPDTGKFVSKEDFNNTVMNYAKLPAIIFALGQEHLQLFGPNAPPPDFVALMEQAPKNKLSLRQQWEQTFKVPERRTEIAKTAHDKEILEAEKRGGERVRSEMLAENPAAGVTIRREGQPGSPVLEISRKHVKDGKPNTEPSPMRGVEAAIAAINQGTYKTGTGT
ncbi:MAG TPA: hypothetical protein VN976_21965 [Verrucomicrobiae bacterium]|nr:hypothetical protein [Verrucomicrobiae bacterium]